MASSSVETDSENINSLLLTDINQPIELEWKLFATDENKVSNFTPDRLESKFWAETNAMNWKTEWNERWNEQNSIWKTEGSNF